MPRLADSIQDLELQGAEDSHYSDPLDREDQQGVGLGQCLQDDFAQTVGRGDDE